MIIHHDVELGEEILGESRSDMLIEVEGRNDEKFALSIALISYLHQHKLQKIFCHDVLNALDEENLL